MTESKLNPFDAELSVMIGDIAKSQPEVEEKPGRYEITVDTTGMQGNAIEALRQAVAGRLGKRLSVTRTSDAAVIFNVEYDPTEYPEQIRTRLVEPDATTHGIKAGERINERTGKEANNELRDKAHRRRD